MDNEHLNISDISIENKVEYLKKQLTKVKHELINCKNDNNAKNTYIGYLKSMIFEKYDNYAEKLLELNEKSMTKNIELTTKLKILEDEIEDLTTQSQAKDLIIENLRKEITQLKKINIDQTTEISRLKTEIDSLNFKNSEQDDKIEKLEKKVNTLGKVIQSNKDKYNRRELELISENNKYKSHLEAKKIFYCTENTIRIKYMFDNFAKLRRMIDKLCSTNEPLKNEIITIYKNFHLETFVSPSNNADIQDTIDLLFYSTAERNDIAHPEYINDDNVLEKIPIFIKNNNAVIEKITAKLPTITDKNKKNRKLEEIRELKRLNFCVNIMKYILTYAENYTG